MGVYDPVPLGRWTPLDVARNIVNVILDQFPEVTVERRQAMNDQLDDFTSGLLDRWLAAQNGRKPNEDHEGEPCPTCGHRLSAYDWCPSCLVHVEIDAANGRPEET